MDEKFINKRLQEQYKYIEDLVNSDLSIDRKSEIVISALGQMEYFIHAKKQLKPMKNIISLEADRLKWSLENFHEATHFSSLEKLREEIKEVEKELMLLEKFPEQEGTLKLTVEYADCLMCLLDSAGRAGVSVESIIEAFAEKL